MARAADSPASTDDPGAQDRSDAIADEVGAAWRWVSAWWPGIWPLVKRCGAVAIAGGIGVAASAVLLDDWRDGDVIAAMLVTAVTVGTLVLAVVRHVAVRAGIRRRPPDGLRSTSGAVGLVGVAVAVVAAGLLATAGDQVAEAVVAAAAATLLAGAGLRLLGAPTWWALLPVAGGVAWTVWVLSSGDPTMAEQVVVGAGVAAAGVAAVALPSRWTTTWTLIGAVTAVVVVVLLLLSIDDGLVHWRGGTALVALGAAAVVLAALLSWQWLNWGWFSWLTVIALCGIALGTEGNQQLHRLAVAALVVTFLVGVAQTMSKATLRATAVLVALVATIGVAGVGQTAGEADAQDTADELRTENDLAIAEVTGASPEVEEVRADHARLAACADGLAGGDECPDDGWDERAQQADLQLAIAQVLFDEAEVEQESAQDVLDEAEAARESAERRLEQVAAAPAVDATALGAANAAVDEAVATEAEEREAVESADADVASRTDDLAEATEQATEFEVPRSSDIRQLLVDGANVIVRDAFRPALGDQVDAVLGSWGWMVLAILALLGYRKLEVRNNRRYGAPIQTAGTTAIDHEFRERVMAMELTEPSPVPGGNTTNDLVEVLKAAEGLPGSGKIAQALKAVWAVAFPPAGVTADLTDVGATPLAAGGNGSAPGQPSRPTGAETGGGGEGELEGSATEDGDKAAGKKGDGGGDSQGGKSPEPSDRTRVTSIRVVLTTTWQGRFLCSHTTPDKPLPDAIEDAANFVAVNAVNYTRLCPPWQRWVDGAGQALDAYRRVEDTTGRHRSLPLASQITLLEAARQISPGTGTVRVALANRYDEAGKPLDALFEHLLARVDFERFDVASYRLATSLTMASDPNTGAWHRGTADLRRDIVNVLDERGVLRRAARSALWARTVGDDAHRDEAIERLRGDRSDDDPPADDAAENDQDRKSAARILLVLAHQELWSLRRRLSYPGLIWMARRQGERHIWLRLMRNTSQRRRTRDRVVTVGMLVELRLALLQHARSDERDTEALCRHVGRILDRAERLVARRRSGAYYNTACMYSLAAQVLSDEDLERLHLSRTATIERSVGLLWRSLRALDVPLPSREWLERDPDLAAVRHEPPFRTLLESLPPARSDGADDGEVTVPPVLTPGATD